MRPAQKAALTRSHLVAQLDGIADARKVGSHRQCHPRQINPGKPQIRRQATTRH